MPYLEIDDLEGFAKDLADIVRQAIAAATAPLQRQLEQQQRRIEQLEMKAIDDRAQLKALQQSDAATWRRPGIKIKGNEKHVQ